MALNSSAIKTAVTSGPLWTTLLLEFMLQVHVYAD